jgi:class 3 adenylate cyclase/tetratricopeptide (TPR) repeat protein
MELRNWLRDLGLERYESAFVDNAIDRDVLPELTESDFEKLGIPLGDRKRLIKAIRTTFADVDNADAKGRVTYSEQPRAAAAERRHLTVMICDLVGSTALSARLDPEDMRIVTDAYHAACARIIAKYDGFLAEFRGDGILAYFGYPRAHEDDAERTVRAGLEIVAAVARLETPAGESLAVRIGIATGLVVIGDLKGEGALREHAVVGHTPNVAGRIQGLGQPGTVVLAASTRRLLGDLFHLRDIGRHEVKGIADPVAAWIVEGVAASDSRFDSVRIAGLTDLIGRKDEIEFLLERQRAAFRGEGQVVVVSGEPGIGKSRLAAALVDRVTEPYTRLRFQCSPYHINSALRPFIMQLETAAGFKASDTPKQRLDKMERVLELDATRAQDTAPLFAALLSIPFDGRYPPLSLDPAQQRRETLAAWLQHFEGLARKQPIMLLFEDAHWADATSLELLELIVRRMERLPALALFTSRVSFEQSWASLSNVSALTLSRLGGIDVEQMIARVTGGRALPREVMEQIVAKTDGNPLFVEELTKAVVESGILIQERDGYRLDGSLPPLAIPETLQDSLMARLDRLAAVKEIAQIGAVIGREFPYLLLRSLVGRSEIALKEALGQLEAAELVFRRGDPPDALYTFKHALVQDAAYESLLKSRRHQLHGQIARALEENFSEVVSSVPELVAHHLTQAGLVDQATGYWLKAGNLALSRSANAEAAKHLRRGMDLTLTQPPSPKRTRRELDFCLALGPALAATQGYAALETVRIFSHARELRGDGGTLNERMTVLWGGYLAHSIRAEHGAALEVARQCLTLATEHQHPGMEALGNRFVGQTLSFMGAFVDARDHLARALALCSAHQETINNYRKFGTDDQVLALSFLASTLLLLGYPRQSAGAAQQAVSRARAINHAFTTALSLTHLGLHELIARDLPQATAYADETLVHSVKHRLHDTEFRARYIQGALLAESGEVQRGIDLMRTAMAAGEHSAARARRTQYLAHLGAAYAKVGKPEVGLDLLTEALQTVEITSERFFEAELHHLRGKILLGLAREPEAEEALRRALTVAQQQQARWWELRAAATLARHWSEQGKDGEARSLLQPAYGWFAEGFETPDLQDARELLETHGASSSRAR